MKYKRKQKGFTIVEFLVVLWGLFIVTLLGGLGYVVVHFLHKFW